MLYVRPDLVQEGREGLLTDIGYRGKYGDRADMRIAIVRACEKKHAIVRACRLVLIVKAAQRCRFTVSPKLRFPSASRKCLVYSSIF